jgi:hypothetical protein
MDVSVEPAAKGISEGCDIFIDRSRHVETVCLLERGKSVVLQLFAEKNRYNLKEEFLSINQ